MPSPFPSPTNSSLSPTNLISHKTISSLITSIYIFQLTKFHTPNKSILSNSIFPRFLKFLLKTLHIFTLLKRNLNLKLSLVTAVFRNLTLTNSLLHNFSSCTTPFNSDEMSEQFSRNFTSHPFSLDQPIPFQFNKKLFKITVLKLNAINVDSGGKEVPVSAPAQARTSESL